MEQRADRVALVTGAGRGIGAEVARQLGRAGFEVIVAARDREAAEVVVEAIEAEGGRARSLVVDLGDASSITAAAGELGSTPLDVLVSNAAAFADWGETASTADLVQARSVMEINLFGTWALIQALLPSLRVRAGGRVVNVGSGSGSHGDPQFGLAANPVAASYAISKAALHALSAKLATELAGEGVRVDVVDPGLTATAPGMEAMGARPVAEGAASVVAAVLAEGDGTGTFTRDGRPMPW